jgi:hypothetical protein
MTQLALPQDIAPKNGTTAYPHSLSEYRGKKGNFSSESA